MTPPGHCVVACFHGTSTLTLAPPPFSRLAADFYFLHRYPLAIRPFYTM